MVQPINIRFKLYFIIQNIYNKYFITKKKININENLLIKSIETVLKQINSIEYLLPQIKLNQSF